MFNNVSTTSVIAVMVVALGFALMAAIAFFPTTVSPEALTQIISFSSAVMMLAGGYYFGSSKQRGVTQQADTITNTPLNATTTDEEVQTDKE